MAFHQSVSAYVPQESVDRNILKEDCVSPVCLHMCFVKDEPLGKAHL